MVMGMACPSLGDTMRWRNLPAVKSADAGNRDEQPPLSQAGIDSPAAPPYLSSNEHRANISRRAACGLRRRDPSADGYRRGDDRTAHPRVLSTCAEGPDNWPGLCFAHLGLGTAFATDVCILVVGRADERPIPRPADAETPATADRCASLRSLACIVRRDRA